MKLPTALLGYVSGPIRWEGPNFFEMYEVRKNKWLVNEKPQVIDRPICITHLQKEAQWGFLLMWPFIFHVWYTFKFQERDDNGSYLPGTEKVLYMRTPGFRFDFADWKYILSKGFLGGNWD